MGESSEESLSLSFNGSTKSIKSFMDSRDENFSKDGFSEDDSGNIYNINSHSKESNIDRDNVNFSNFIENFPKDFFEIFVTNEKEENASNSQLNNLIIEMESKNNNSTKIKMPLISQENISENNSNKGKKHIGRKKNVEKVNESEGSSHNMYSNDNISVRIQTHFLNFIIALLNCIIPYFNYKKKLYKLDKKLKINIKKKNEKNVESLHDKTIGNIIANNKISEKYISINDKINANKNIYEEIKDIPVLNKILSENYLVFFKKFYYNSDSYINLKDYGLDEDIIFSKDVKNFKRFLKDNKNRGIQYIITIKRHVLKEYLPGSIFIY